MVAADDDKREPDAPTAEAEAEGDAVKDAPPKKQLSLEEMHNIVDKVPGAEVFREGMKVPGQEEREAREAEWMRGEFDPVGDGAVAGYRVERGEGRSAEEATGPQCGDDDDVLITLFGTPVAGDYTPFFVPRGSERALANHLQSSWLVRLSDPRLSEYWVKSLRAMSKKDVCRFTCAAKKSQAWLQSLADCCEALDGGKGGGEAVQLPSARVQVQPSGRMMVVDVRIDDWLKVTNVAKKTKKTGMYKRVYEVPAAVKEMTGRTQEERLAEELRYAGDYGAQTAEEGSTERRRRLPRAPDRVRVHYTLRKRLPGTDNRWEVVATDGSSKGRGKEFSLGGGMGAVGERPWVALEEACGNLEEGERSSFTFSAFTDRLPIDKAPLAGQVVAGDLVELDVKLEYLLKQTDISANKSLSITKCKLAAGKGFWKPRTHYRITFSAAAAPRLASPKDGRRTPSGVAQYTYVLGGGRGTALPAADADETGGASGPGYCDPLDRLFAGMSVDEVALLTAHRDRLKAWPSGPLAAAMPTAASDGSVTLWVRVDAIQRVEMFADGEVAKATLTSNDLEWLEKMFVETKGEIPMLEEDVHVDMAVGASDGSGKLLFPQDRQLHFCTGDMPLAEDWMLMIFMTMYENEKATITARGDRAGQLIDALCKMRHAQGGCTVDAKSAAAHVASAGLELTVKILRHQPPSPKDGVTGKELLATAEDLKERANALLNAGFVAGAMRKYVRATWLMQDGKEKEDPGAPMTEVVGVGKGAEPRHCRFGTNQAAAVKALRVSLHLNLAAGALKLAENYGALAAAQVARELEPEAVKPLYREAQAYLALQDYDAAKATLARLLQIEPQNAAARKLREAVKAGAKELATRERRSFVGLFSRAQREGPLFSPSEIERQRQSELKKTQYVRDRAEEKRRGVEMLDTQALSRLPEEYQQKEIDKMNECIENDTRQSKVPDGLTEQQFQRILQMRTDGDKEEKVQAELARLKREDMIKTKKHMLASEIERMRERQEAIERDRYKSDEIIEQRQRELEEEYADIKKRVEKRRPLIENEQRRQKELAEECQQIMESDTADDEERRIAMKKMLHDPFKDLDGYLTDAEMHELNEIKARPLESNVEGMNRLQKLLTVATERRIEDRIDELIEREDDVLV